MKKFFCRVLANFILAPIAAIWVKSQERRICASGASLTYAQREWANSIGIEYIDNIRIIREPSLAFPAPKWLASFSEKRGIGLSNAAGMSLRYGIFISSKTNVNQYLLCHELTHTLQYERAGSIYKFLCNYLFECIYYGYPKAPMEKEADEVAKFIVILSQP